MTHAGLGTSRVESAQRRLKELNPRLEILSVAENLSEANAERLVGEVDLVVDCAPLFPERFAMNRQCIEQKKPLVDCAMYDLEGQVTTILPGETPCLACLYPEDPPSWRREFPVFGAVSGTIGCLGAMEAIKVLSGLGEPLAGTLLTYDLRDMTFRRRRLLKLDNCSVCGSTTDSGES
jgi:molybdopterin/thiamine biosynthesis adenylyltransferase